ncbi:MAG: hypothetical protein HY076_06270, partial [Candidatus Eisenbacteria bacterium]|nr:hypothetical protein [Candidatus Eisenbacteria bacterium]
SWVSGNRLSYAIRLAYTLEVEDRGYFDFFSIPQGDYIGRRTDEVPAPDTFTPDHNEATTLTGGIGLSYKVTGTITAAAMVHHSRSVIKSRNIALRSESHVNEERPVDLGEFGLHGTLGKHIEWIADGQGWSSHSEEFFIWTVSAGATQAPLAGSGKMLDRDAEGTALRTRARWTSGTLQIDAGFNTSYSRTITTPWYPPAGALLAGFNDFLDQVGFRTNADSLALPARIVNGRIEARGYEYSGGFSWRSPWRHALIGAEFHSRRTRYAQPSYTGPVPKGWDVRGGAEVRLAPTVLGRLGYVVGYDDADDLSAANTFLRRTATFGLGFQPAGSRWSADLGYAFQWVDPDFGDPSRARGSQQELALQLRWPF